MKLRAATLIACAAVASVSLSACSHDDHKAVRPSATSSNGASVIQHTGAYTALPIKTTAPISVSAESVRTPDGSWQISMAKSSATYTDSGVTYTAPSGYVLVPVTWLYTPNPPTYVGSNASGGPDAPSTRLNLHAGSRSISVTPNPTTSGSALLTLAASSVSAANLSVDFDGVSQKVDASGVRDRRSSPKTDALYDSIASLGTGVCPEVRSQFSSTGGQFFGTCGLSNVSRAAWLPGRGWAGDHQVWIQVTGVLNPGTMTWVDKVDGKNVVTNYDSTASLTGAQVGGSQAVSVETKHNQYLMLFRAPANTGSMNLKVNELFTGSAKGDIKSGLSAPKNQSAAVEIVSSLSFQRS